MPEITLEKIYGLLEHLADYVMTEIPILKQDVAALKYSVEVLERRIAALEHRVTTLEQDVVKLNGKIDYIIDGMGAQVKELDIIRTERAATERTFHVNNERIAELEERVLGRRIRDKKDD